MRQLDFMDNKLNKNDEIRDETCLYICTCKQYVYVHGYTCKYIDRTLINSTTRSTWITHIKFTKIFKYV